MDLQQQLDGKSNVGHTHGDSELLSLSWAKLLGVPSTFAPSAHVHSVSEVTDLINQLSAKMATVSFPTQLQLYVTNLSTLLGIPDKATAVTGQCPVIQSNGTIAWSALPQAGAPDTMNDPRPARYGEGVLSGRPVADSTNLGHFYRTTDENPSTLYRSTSSAWVAIASVGISTGSIEAATVVNGAITTDGLSDDMQRDFSLHDAMSNLVLSSYTL